MNWSSTNPSALNLSSLEKNILIALACHESQNNIPATCIEIHRYLIKKESGTAPSLIQTLKSFKNLAAQAFILQEKGLFFLSSQPFSKKIWQERILRQKISIKKWKKVKKIMPWLKIVPFVEGVIASGSVIFNNAKDESDLDLLVISKKGRIWTCRMILSFFLELLRQRRSTKAIKDKICLNHYLAKPWFKIKIKNYSTAQFYAHLVPLISYRAYHSFHKKNQWIKNFLYFSLFERRLHQKRINEKNLIFRLCSFFGSFFELFLKGKLGDWLERKSRAWQIKRVKGKTPAKDLRAEKIYLSDKTLVFHHPVCRYAQVKKTFQEKIKKLNLA